MNSIRFHFVYNANSGWLNTGLDIAHKILSPSTYSCDLCHLTHGVLNERETLSHFKTKYPEKITFYHKDDILPKLIQNGPFPSIWMENNNTVTLFQSPEQISKTKNIDEILNLIANHL